MDIKKANVNLLLGKIRDYLDSQPDARKKGKRFIEADKALARLEKVFADQKSMVKKIPCKLQQIALPES